MPSFSDALKLKAEDIKRPPLLPVGHYVCQVSKIPEITKAENADYEFVDVPFKVAKPTEDVDPDELREFGGLNNVNRTKRFIFNNGEDDEAKAAFNRELFKFKRFLTEHLKVEGNEQTPLPQLIDNSPGK